MQYEKLKKLAKQYREPLASVEKILIQETSDSDFDFINRAARHITLYEGKRLRPLLCLVIAENYGEIKKNHISFCVITELLHTATLLHDDVLDDAEMRRHKRSVKSQWGNQTSVLLGDYLFARAFRILSELLNFELFGLISKTTQEICEGELLQTCTSWKMDLSEDFYLTMVRKKTAELFSASCKGSAIISGATNKEINILSEYGRKIGIAFQISDDLMDLLGKSNEEGKTLGTDIKKGKLTLPLIHLLRGLGLREKRELISKLQDPSSDWNDEEIKKLIALSDNFNVTFQYVARICKDAESLIKNLPRNTSLDLLSGIPQYILARVEQSLRLDKSSNDIEVQKIAS